MKAVTFEKSIERLEEIIEELESGEFPLEDSLKKYEEGLKLAQYCKLKLEEARKKVETLAKEKDGKYSKKKFDPTDGKEVLQ
ncbi:MAG: exodeoxyribonuclease VII small subunit [Candidatus Omnitrophica bacterium]|nr:exodeoxyribonuclease VII small subunit [Candidatus Omnitrophota bacterium]